MWSSRSWSARYETQAGHHDDVVPRACGAFTSQRLDARHIVARLEAHPNAAYAELTADAAVRGKVVCRVDVELAVVVAASTRASPGERSEADCLACDPAWGAHFSAYVVREQVELGVAGGGDVAAAGPTQCGRDGECRTRDVRQLHCAEVAALDGVALRARRNERAGGDDELPARRLPRGRLGVRNLGRKAARGHERRSEGRGDA